MTEAEIATAEMDDLVRKHGDAPVNLRFLLEFVKSAGLSSMDWVARSLKKRDDRLDELERRVTELTAMPATIADAYRGTWQPAQHARGDLVVWGGSLFLCLVDTRARPETDDSWRLICKRGKDGRDGKDAAR